MVGVLPKERERKRMFVPDRTRSEGAVEQKGSVEVQSFAGNARSMHKDADGLGADTGRGRRAAAGVGSSYLVRRDFVGRGLHSQPFAALAGLLA
jgi:hypothetical protein